MIDIDKALLVFEKKDPDLKVFNSVLMCYNHNVRIFLFILYCLLSTI